MLEKDGNPELSKAGDKLLGIREGAAITLEILVEIHDKPTVEDLRLRVAIAFHRTLENRDSFPDGTLQQLRKMFGTLHGSYSVLYESFYVLQNRCW